MKKIILLLVFLFPGLKADFKIINEDYKKSAIEFKDKLLDKVMPILNSIKSFYGFKPVNNMCEAIEKIEVEDFKKFLDKHTRLSQEHKAEIIYNLNIIKKQHNDSKLARFRVFNLSKKVFFTAELYFSILFILLFAKQGALQFRDSIPTLIQDSNTFIKVLKEDPDFKLKDIVVVFLVVIMLSIKKIVADPMSASPLTWLFISHITLIHSLHGLRKTLPKAFIPNRKISQMEKMITKQA